MARLDRLATGKRVYQTAAAIGREFTIELLERVCDLDGAALQNALDALVDAGLLVSRQTASGATYVFRHAFFRTRPIAACFVIHGKNCTRVSPVRLHRRGSTIQHCWRITTRCANAWEEVLNCRLLAAAKAESRGAALGGGRALPARHPRSRTPSRHGGAPANLP